MIKEIRDKNQTKRFLEVNIQGPLDAKNGLLNLRTSREKEIPENAKSIQREKPGYVQINENYADIELLISNTGHLKIIEKYLLILEEKWLWNKYSIPSQSTISVGGINRHFFR